MASIGQTFNVNALPQDEGNDFTPLPEGWYDVEVAKTELRQTKDGSGQYISLRLKVTGPTHAGRGIFTNLNITNRSPDAERIGRAQLRSILECGNIQEFSNTDQLMGVRLSVKVAIKPARVDQATGKQYDADNEVKAYRPIAGNAMPSMPAQAFAPAQQPAFAPQPAYQAPAQQAPAIQQPASASAPWQQPAPAQSAPAAPVAGATPPWLQR